MNVKLVTLCSTIVLTFGGLAFLRYKRRKEGWTVLEKVILGAGVTAVVVTVVITTRDYNRAKSAIESVGEIATDQAIVNITDFKSMQTLGDIAKEFNLTHQKARYLIKDLDITHAGEVVRTGLDYGWYCCKVYDLETASLIRKTLAAKT